MFAPPPPVELLSGDGLSCIEVDISVFARGEHPGLQYGCADVADCFHRTRLSGDIRHFFWWPGVSNRYLKLTEVEGRKISPDQTLWPMCCSLPIGFSRSLYFAQSANRARLNRKPSLRRSVEMTDRGPPLVLSGRSRDAQTGHYLYVDNIGVVSNHVSHVHLALNERARKTSRNTVSSYTRIPCFLVLVGLSASTSTSHSFELFPRQRAFRIREGLRCFLKRRRVAGWELEALMGHVTFLGLLRRETPSLFHCACRFARKCYHQQEPLWTSARAVLEAFIGAMILDNAGRSRPWLSGVRASDASLSRYGVAQAFWSTSVVAAVGRVREGRRLRCGTIPARRHASESSRFSCGRE